MDYTQVKKRVKGKELKITLPIIKKDYVGIIYKVDYLNNSDEVVGRNIGQCSNQKDILNRAKRHIVDRNDKTSQWLVEHLRSIDKINIKILYKVDKVYCSSEELKSKLIKLEGFYNAKSHNDGIATINQFTYFKKLYCTNGLTPIKFSDNSSVILEE